MNFQGISPKVRDMLFKTQGKHNAGDFVIVVKPSNVTPEPTAAAWSYTVPFEIQTAAGELVNWTGDIAAAAGDTSTAGTASVSDATPAVVNGKGSVVLSGDEADWLDTETATLTLSLTDEWGDSLSDTFVVTFTA